MRSIRRPRLATAVLLSAACASSAPHPEPEPEYEAAIDTVNLVARGDTFLIVVARDTSLLYRITGTDTTYVSRSVAEGPGRAPGAVGFIVPLAIPEGWEAEADSTGYDVAGVPSPLVERDTLRLRDLEGGTSLAEYISEEVSDFLARARTDSAVPAPAAWPRAHPGDRLERAVGDDAQHWRYDDFAGRWCARSTWRVRTGDGRVSVRRVLFYPPPMPPSARLPTISDEVGAEFERCRLGSLRIETDTDSSAAASVSTELRLALTNRLGHEAPAPRPPGISERRWTRYATWRVGEATVVTTHKDFYRGVQVAAWTPAAGLELPDHYSPWSDPHEGVEEEVREVARLGGLDVQRALRLLAAARDRQSRWAGVEPAERPRLDSLLLDRLEAWIAEGRALRPERRAASLLIGDRALATADLGAMGPDSAAVRRRLLDLGATLEKVWGDDYYRYAGDLLLEAYGLARGTPVGDRAFLQLLASGFDPSPNCPETGGWPRVIERGEAFLAEAQLRRTVDPAILAETHRLVAQAYADIVAIVAGQVPLAWHIPEPDEMIKYGPEDAASARRRAVAHYQAALDLMARSADRASVWRYAWRLAAGLPPLETRFLCAWD